MIEKIILLGASGSIGTQTIDVIKHNRRKFILVGISLGTRHDALKEILEDFPTITFVVVKNKDDAEVYKNLYPHLTFAHGDEGLLKLINEVEATLVVNALVGFVGLPPTIAALKKNVDVALANKETLVVGGEIIKSLLKKEGPHLYSIDSEHVALAKCLKARRNIERLILTASGGSFRHLKREQLHGVTVEEALKHPSWKMGSKITIDSATMMNKGFELIEAHYLFNFPLDKIAILMHDESKIHSLVEFKDGSYLADIGPSDMRVPISYALHRGQRTLKNYGKLSLEDFGSFHFHTFDPQRYPCVEFAKRALTFGGTMPTVLNASNEEAVYAFLRGEIQFLDIERIIELTMKRHRIMDKPNLEDIQYIDIWTRNEVTKIIKEIKLCNH